MALVYFFSKDGLTVWKAKAYESELEPLDFH
jgi:hypothetical protein